MNHCKNKMKKEIKAKIKKETTHKVTTIDTTQRKQGVIAIIRKGDKFLLGYECKQSPIKNTWRLLGGKIEPGETPEQTLHRELDEEAKISITIRKKLCMKQGSYTDIDIYVYLADYKNGIPTPNMTEIDRIGWFSIEETRDLPMDAVSRNALEEFAGQAN
jgi:mutator protein MutT